LKTHKYRHARGNKDNAECEVKYITNELSAQRDANTARALAVVRFGHRPPARAPSHPLQTCQHTDRTDYNTLRCS